MTVYICDWTHWQGKPLPASGVAGAEGFGMVKLKVGGSIRQGRFFEDPTFFDSAVALLDEPRLIPSAFWYLMPGRASAQAGLFYDLLSLVDLPSWAAFLDVEQDGLNWRDVERFRSAWSKLSKRPLHLYTQRRLWERLGAPVDLGQPMFPVLEEAHWVPASVRNDATKPYASQQAKGIDPAWWKVKYGGWAEANILQFTDTAMVQGVRTSASIYRGTQAELRTLFAGPA